MTLTELERAMWNAVRTRGAPPANLNDWLAASPRQSAADRLRVYHLAYWQRQVAALSATFPRTVTLLGSDRLLLKYIELHPCTEPCIEQLGRNFAPFLAARSDVTSRALGVAQLEWAETATLLSVNPSSVVALPRRLGDAFAEHRLQFVPSLHVEHVAEAAFRYWKGESATSEGPGMLDVAFFRPQHTVLHVLLERDEAHAYELALGGATIAVVCSAFSSLPPEQAAQRALQVIVDWFGRSWVTSCNR